MNRKEMARMKEFTGKEMEILAITETKKKGCGEMTIEEHETLYSGVHTERRAEARVGCLLSLSYRNKLVDWKPMNERIMRIKLR